MPDVQSTWTDERIERLKTLWGEGLTASQIAAELGGISRNAVIGKVHRLGLSGRKGIRQPAEAAAPERKRRTRRAKPAPAPTVASHGNLAHALEASPLPEPELEAVEDTADVVPMARHLTLVELDAFSCRWPIGDPLSPDFRFCGAPTLPGQVYCSACSRKAYQPKPDRTRHSPKPRGGTRREGS